MTKTAKFNIGDLVVHTHQGYRAIVVDVDPLFQASGRYNPQSCKRDFTTRHPWYRLLVDKSSQVTYVEEPFLIADLNQQAIDNPNINEYLIELHGHYHSIVRHH